MSKTLDGAASILIVRCLTDSTRNLAVEPFAAAQRMDSYLKEATQVIEQERLIQLTEADAVLIQRLLDDPPKPNAKMLKAIEAHRELCKGG